MPVNIQELGPNGLGPAHEGMPQPGNNGLIANFHHLDNNSFIEARNLSEQLTYFHIANDRSRTLLHGPTVRIDLQGNHNDEFIGRSTRIQVQVGNRQRGGSSASIIISINTINDASIDESSQVGLIRKIRRSLALSFRHQRNVYVNGYINTQRN